MYFHKPQVSLMFTDTFSYYCCLHSGPAMEPPTLEELVKKVGISLHLLDQKCSDDHLRSISLFLDWRSVAPHLGLSERDIEAIEFDKKTEDERRLAVLQKWKRKYGYKATLKRLVAVLLAVGNADDAEQVCCLLPTPAGIFAC